MARSLYKLTNEDVIVMLILLRHQNATAKKVERFLRVFAEYLKNGSTDFHQAYVIFWQSSKESFEIKRLKTGHSFFPW